MKRLQARTLYRVTCARCTSTGSAEIGITGVGTEVVDRAHQDITSSTFLDPFAPPALPGLNARMGPLTPAQPALRTGRFLARNPALEHRSRRHAGLPASRRRTFRPFRLQPPLAAPGPWSGFAPQAYRQHDSRSSASLLRDHRVSWASPLGSRLATTTGRIEFVILRTGRSPPVALHLLSRERSYHRLQSTDLTLAGTPTPRIQRAHRRTATVGLSNRALLGKPAVAPQSDPSIQI